MRVSVLLTAVLIAAATSEPTLLERLAFVGDVASDGVSTSPEGTDVRDFLENVGVTDATVESTATAVVTRGSRSPRSSPST